MSVLDLARPDLRKLVPYSSARMEAQAADVMLNANESPWPPTDDDGLALNRYPEPQPGRLLGRMAELYGVRPGQVLIGRGSDEAIDLLVRGFCRPDVDAVALCPPTFGMYEVCARIQAAVIEKVPFTGDFVFEADVLLAALSPVVRVLFLCSPNNPTGGVVRLNQIDRIAAALSERCLVIIDEAYIEFADAPSASSLIDRHENLGVLRTLSKAWSLAGARVGALLANEQVVNFLRRIMAPYPLPTPSVAAALSALDDQGLEQMQRRVVMTRSERARVAEALLGLSSVRAVLRSQANFLAVEFDDAASAYRRLLGNGVVVRELSGYPGLADYLRISIGTPQENSRLIDVLKQRAEAA